jgi:tRNA A-37 threonylcarbamoyl transferase component Bud32
VERAIAEHRRNAGRGREACEHLGRGASVSRVVLEVGDAQLDLAVKWNHWRGWRGAASDAVRGSRARRALRGAALMQATGLSTAAPLAVAERRQRGAVRESFLVTRFLAHALPLPALAPELRGARARRRALVRALGDTLGRLHAAGLHHSDLKHSNLMIGPGERVTLLDLECLLPRRRPSWPRRVRALGQLEAFAADLYPWLPLTDRMRFLRAYLDHAPHLVGRRRELVRDVEKWVARRLREWAARDRREDLRFPLAPRRPGAAPPAAPGPHPERRGPPDAGAGR